MITLDFSTLKARDHWMRLVYMVIFSFVVYFAPYIIIGMAALQFLHISFLSKSSLPLKHISNAMCAFFYQTVLYMTYQSNKVPFPFSNFPDA